MTKYADEVNAKFEIVIEYLESHGFYNQTIITPTIRTIFFKDTAFSLVHFSGVPDRFILLCDNFIINDSSNSNSLCLWHDSEKNMKENYKVHELLEYYEDDKLLQLSTIMDLNLIIDLIEALDLLHLMDILNSFEKPFDSLPQKS